MANDVVGSVVALWRYPIKSMLGEELNAAAVAECGLVGDRAYALIDSADGKVVSAKNPKKWPNLFDFRAAYTESPRLGAPLPSLRVTLPDGTTLMGDGSAMDQTIAAAVGRPVTLRGAAPEAPVLEEYWPDVEGLPRRDTVTDETMPARSFFDLAPVHLLTTATLDHLRVLYSAGRFEVRRFRPNVVLATDEAGFVEGGWIGRVVALGSEVRLRITGHCPRCVMTTLAQSDLPRDPGILRTAAQHNSGHVGVYASVERGGTVRRGDTARLE